MDYEKREVKEKIRTMWKEEKDDFYAEVLDEFHIESGDVSPSHAQRLDEVEDEMVEVLTNWVLSRLDL